MEADLLIVGKDLFHDGHEAKMGPILSFSG
jgi:hypothetical protein